MNIIMQDTNKELIVNKEIFGYDYKEGLVHQAVVSFMNKSRQGDSAQKTRAEVRGGGKKPWRQKGTGRARVGSIRSPLWRSGGVIFAAKKRDYSQKINKKMYKRAMRSIVSELVRKDKLVVINEFKCESSKTKDFINKMKLLNISDGLVVLKEVNEFEYLAARNLRQYNVCDIKAIDPVCLLSFDKVVITEAAVRILEEQLQ